MFGWSLSTRLVGAIILTELLVGLAIGATVSAISLRTAAADRRESLSYVAAVVAASIMPVVADQDPTRLRTQLDSIVELAEGYEIECIRLTDTTGHVLAETESGCTCEQVERSGGLLDLFTEPQVVERSIVVDDLPVAVTSVQFRPTGLEDVLWQPLRATGVVVLGVVALTTLWGTWLTLRTVVEPIERLRDGAERIAEGRRDLSLSDARRDEIGQLARALDGMMNQLEEKEDFLVDTNRSLGESLRAQELLGAELQRSIQVRSDFVAVASHELRSPLAIIRLYAEMMAAGEFGDLDRDVQDALDSIIAAATRLGYIMTSLMDVALLDRGIMSLEVSEFRLDDLIREAAKDAAALGAPSGVEVSVVGPLPDVMIEGDALRIRQVLDNLFSNAVKYADGEPVDVSLEIDAGCAIAVVRDRGRGIPGDRLHVLFEPFGRVDSGDDASTSGVGLGLAISARILEAHGGTLVARPDPAGRGVSFRMSLPLDRSETESSTVSVVDDA
jgi:signal transduction histidine kinase